MGLFSSIFGGGRKQDFSQIIPEPPRFNLAQGSQGQYTGGLQDLIDVFTRRSQGQDQFDYLKYLFEPQESMLNQQYGINTSPGDVYSQRSGVLPQTLASLNQRGLLDTGTSGVIEGQLRSNLANKLAELFGQSKQLQRGDIDESYNALAQLFPQRFQAQNIQSQIDYDNAMNSYDALLRRNTATVGQQAQSDAAKSRAWQTGIGLALAAAGGAAGGAGLFGTGSQIGAGGWAGAGAGALGGLTGSYSPMNVFGGGGGGMGGAGGQGRGSSSIYSQAYPGSRRSPLISGRSLYPGLRFTEPEF